MQQQVYAGNRIDPAAVGRVQQAQCVASQDVAARMPGRPPMLRIPQAQTPYSTIDPYAYGVSPVAAHSAIDPRLATPESFGLMPNMHGDFSPYMRCVPEAALVPSLPRGPPRKPKQSGHALWVGNLPPAAMVTDLKDHFSRDATKDIESLFLICKSNCAFVNYRSEAACVAAGNRFHDSFFQGVRLVCRVRHGAATGPSTTSADADTPEALCRTTSLTEEGSPAIAEKPTSPTIVSGNQRSPSTTVAPAPVAGSSKSQRVPEKFFILKSLTVQDLASSVRSGIWATQSHNETALNQAFDEADNVFLVFSANKSGEYFGYARMASKISGQPVNLNSTLPSDTHVAATPQSIQTPASVTAPKGHIIDDSARGSIFWEAEHADEKEDDSPEKESLEGESGQSWGRQFSIEWLSISRLLFYRTRGLRNPWNSNREVKIARDGTELEPSVGRRLVQMFHRPPQGPIARQPGMPYR